MPSQIDITALYQKEDWEDQADYDRCERSLVNNAPPAPAHCLILGYTDVSDLVNQVNALLTIDPDHPCLRSLEITAHGCPTSCNDLFRTTVSSWAQQLMPLKWCDLAYIYLSGCNTGLPRDRSGLAPTRVGPLAKALADAMPFSPTTFPHHIIVYGSAGYLSGTKAEGNLDCAPDYSTGSLWWKETYETYPGARAASGQQVWNPFQNW